MLRNCLSALLNSLSNNFSGEKDSRKIKRQKTVSRTRTLRFEPCEDRTMLSVSPFNSEDVTAHWTFDVNTEDTNGAFIGSLNNGASLTTNGISGGGLSLDGVDDYFSIGDPEELQIINEITLAAWIVPESTSGAQNIIAKGYSTHPNGEIFLRIANGKYQVGSWTGSEHLAEFAIPSSDIGERVHLAGTYDGTTWRLYRNGVEIASTVDDIGAVEVDGAWAVGARGTGTERFYKGVIDEVVISSTVYTAQEIAALASIPTNAQEDNSVTWNWSDVQSGEIYSEQGGSLGSLTNGATVQTDLNYGQVLNLSGNNGYVSLGNPDDLQIHGEITLSAWICPNSLNGAQNIIAKGYSTNPDGEIFLRIADGEYQVGSWDGDDYHASVAADANDIGQWIQLTGVYDGAAWRLYKNGVLAATTSSTVGAVPVNANWSIGSNASGTDRFFNGKVGAGGIYDHALDAQAVAALMSDSQTTARVGGNPYAIKDQSYVLQLDASTPGVLWTVNWGDGTTEEFYNVSSASHVYTHYGTSGVSVTAKRNGRSIDVAGSSIGLQIGSVDEMIINGDFESVAIPDGTYWAIYDTIPGWTGPVEIQINNGSKVAELDTDSRYSDLDPSESDHQSHHTSIYSSPLSFTPGLTYTLSFDAWNRSDYAQDNILNVTVPGEIISVNGNTPVSTLLDLIDEDDLGAFSFTSISYDSVTFSAGGSYYETDDGNGGITYTLGASPFHVSSITFVAASNSGYVSFSDVSSDIVPCNGPLLDNISMNQEYLYVDIDVDSNNDGVINGFDDPVEMAANGGKILAVGYGQCQPINLSVHTNQTNLASDNIVYQLEYDNSKILLYNTESLPQAVYGTEIDISPYYIAPNTDLPNGFLTLDGTIKTIYVDGFVLGETTVTLKAYSVYQNSSGNTVRELISSDEIKLNVGFDLDTDSNEDGTIDSTSNFTLSAGKLSVLPPVEDMVEDLAEHGKTLIVDATEATRVEINTSDIAIPNGVQFQIIISAGLNAWADASKTQRLTEVTDSKFTVANLGCYQDDTIGEVYTLQANSLENIVFFVEASGFIEPTDAFSIDNSIISLTLDTVRRTTSIRLVTSDNQTLAHDTISFLCECQNVIFCGIDGTDTKEWLTGPNAKREDNIKWNSHIRNLFVDINTKYKGYFYGPNILGTDCSIIHDNALSMIEDMYTTSGQTAKIVIVGFSRGAMIAQWIANDLSDAGISVEFVGLYDPVDMSIISGTESVIASNIKNELIIGPEAFTGQPIFNPDYWYIDFDPVSIDFDPIEVNGIPFIRMAMNGRMTVSSLLTNVERLNLNASHGAIGGMPGYNDQSENTVNARMDSEWFNPIASRYRTSYYYTLDVDASFHADYRVRTKCVELGIYVRILEFDDYKFFSANPVCL